MSSVVPPSATPPPQPVQLPKALILTAPSALLALPAGSTLDVTLAEALPGNQLTLSTPLGDVQVRLAARAALNVGDRLILQWLGGGKGGAATQGQILLSLADGRPLPLGTQGGHGTAKAAGQAGAVGTAGATAPALPKLQAGQTVSATLLRPAPLTPGTIISNFQAAQAGGNAAAGVTQQTPDPSPAGRAPQAAPVTGAPQRNAAGAPAQPPPGQAPQAAGVLPAGSTLVLKITAARPPEGTAPPPPPQGAPIVSLAPGQSLSGTVAGQHNLTHAVVQTPAGPLSVPTAQALPTGTQLSFEVVSLSPPPPAAGAHGLGQAAAPVLDGPWPTLDEAAAALRDVAPGAYTQLIQSSIPRADAQLTANVLFFMSALRGGDMKGWLGDGPLRILERQRPDLAGRLRDDMGQMSRTIDDPQTGEWRLHGLPFMAGGEIDRILMLIRDGGSEDDAEDGDGGTRFVIDLNLSRLGHIQVDGLVGEKGKRLDVVVRTDAPLDADMRQDIRALYANAIEVTGIEGSVGFQTQPANFIEIPKPPPPDGLEEGVVI